jgi:serine/threonine protein kinase
VFQPGFDCKGNVLKSTEYISKIQKNTPGFQRENEISDIVKSIPHYNDLFSPILENCDLSIANWENDEIHKCNFMKEDTDTSSSSKIYKTSKTQYIGEHSLAEYLYSIFVNEDPGKNPVLKNISILVSSHYSLLVSLNILLKAGIIHNNIKEHNIMISILTKMPIITNFELAINKNQIENYNFANTFNEYWCIDICILSYIFTKIKDNWREQLVTREDIDLLIADFFDNSERTLYSYNTPDKIKMTAYLQQFIGNKWQIVFETMIKTNNTWDNYALAVTYIYIIHDLQLNEIPLMKNYLDFLFTQIVFATPEERPTIEQTLIQIQELTSVLYMDFDKLGLNHQYVFNKEDIFKNIQKTKISQIEIEMH